MIVPTSQMIIKIPMAKPHPDYDLAAWVLGKFPPEDAKAIADRYPDLEAAAKLIMDGKLSLAQSKYNG